jgi:hypothetical protein
MLFQATAPEARTGPPRPPTHQPFSEEEDQKLIHLIELYGTKRWSLLSHHMQSRTAKQCRERWNYHLNPDLNRGPWTPQEDRIIADRHRELGNKWTKIAKFLPGRTDSSVKNRWNSQLKNRQPDLQPPPARVIWQPVTAMDFTKIPPLIQRDAAKPRQG